MAEVNVLIDATPETEVTVVGSAIKGDKGDDGYSPTVHVSEIAEGYRVSITDASGVHEYIAYNGQDGAPGTDGDDGFSPEVTVTEITGGHRVTITDADGTHQFDVLNGEKGDPGEVTDVQVDGESVVSEGVATIPYAGSSQAGVVRASATYGISVNSSNHLLIISSATEANIDNRTTYKPIVSSRIDYAVKAAMTDGVGAAWTDAEKVAGRERMGAASESMVSDAWTSKATWNAGEICIYNNRLWKCKVTNSAPPSEGANWTETDLTSELQAISSVENFTVSIPTSTSQSFDCAFTKVGRMVWVHATMTNSAGHDNLANVSVQLPAALKPANQVYGHGQLKSIGHWQNADYEPVYTVINTSGVLTFMGKTQFTTYQQLVIGFMYVSQ